MNTLQRIIIRVQSKKPNIIPPLTENRIIRKKLYLSKDLFFNKIGQGSIFTSLL